MADDEEEGGFGGLYEDGHWMWDENTEALIFIRSLSTYWSLMFLRIPMGYYLIAKYKCC